MIHRSGHQSFLLAIALLLAFSVASCARGSEVEPPSPPPSTEELDDDARIEDGPETEEDSDPDALVLDEAEIHFAEGRYRTAATLFERYLEEGRRPGNGEGHADRALWGLAMLHLLPESPLHDRDEAMGVLDRLVEDHRESMWGMQARWVRGLMEELDEVRGQVVQQEDLLRQLTETVEQLRRIDLNRRPTGSGDTITSRGDTIPTP